jgi:hypothetical protein
MDTTLKACPVCGSEAELKNSYYLESERPYSYVHCTNHDCELHPDAGKVQHFAGDSEAANSANAIAAWNGEAAPQATG